MSKLIGQHTFKVGVDYRFIGIDFQSFDEAPGNFLFDAPLHLVESDAERHRRHDTVGQRVCELAARLSRRATPAT